MTRPPEPAIEETTGCIYCSRTAELEQDGGFAYFVCGTCSGEFGYRRIISDVPLCAAGLPIRAGAAQSQPVFLGSVIKRRQD